MRRTLVPGNEKLDESEVPLDDHLIVDVLVC